MADVMRAATPINNRNIIQPAKEHRDVSTAPMDFQDISKVKSTLSQSETLGQNNVLRENGSSTVLYSLLQDPDVASSFLKNIFFLREIVGLMPLNNETQTEEMQQLMDRLILSPEEIPQEMQNQENISTIFKGKLFDTLRQILQTNGKSVSENIFQKVYTSPAPSSPQPSENVPASKPLTQSQMQNETFENTENIQAQVKSNEILSENLSTPPQGENIQQTSDSLPPSNELKDNNTELSPSDDLTKNPTETVSDDKATAFFNLVNENPNIPDEMKKFSTSKLVKEAFANNTETSQKEVQDSVINLLKSISLQENKGDFLDAVKNNLLFLKESFPENSEFSQSLGSLAKAFGEMSEDETTRGAFKNLKLSTLGLMENLKTSVLYNAEIDKTASLVKYNLSRYNDNDNLVAESFSKLLTKIPDEKLKAKLTNDLVEYLETAEKSKGTQGSKTMSALADILQKQSENAETKMLNSDSIDKIVHGLLSSPSNFTPLLHYVVPVDDGKTQAMAEIWINPNGQEDIENVDAIDKKTKSAKKLTHMLVVFEIEKIGKFEAELFAEDKSLTLLIFCPEEHLSAFKNVNADIRRACENTGYRFRNIEISKMKASRSLMDVFGSLPARRSGINVTI